MPLKGAKVKAQKWADAEASDNGIEDATAQQWAKTQKWADVEASDDGTEDEVVAPKTGQRAGLIKTPEASGISADAKGGWVGQANHATEEEEGSEAIIQPRGPTLELRTSESSAQRIS